MCPALYPHLSCGGENGRCTACASRRPRARSGRWAPKRGPRLRLRLRLPRPLPRRGGRRAASATRRGAASGGCAAARARGRLVGSPSAVRQWAAGAPDSLAARAGREWPGPLRGCRAAATSRLHLGCVSATARPLARVPKSVERVTPAVDATSRIAGTSRSSSGRQMA